MNNLYFIHFFPQFFLSYQLSRQETKEKSLFVLFFSFSMSDIFCTSRGRIHWYVHLTAWLCTRFFYLPDHTEVLAQDTHWQQLPTHLNFSRQWKEDIHGDKIPLVIAASVETKWNCKYLPVNAPIRYAIVVHQTEISTHVL